MKLFAEPPLGSIPPLYKYLPLANDEQIERARQIVLGRSIYFASPVQFNDPQESIFDVTFNGTTEELKKLCQDIVQQQRPEFTPEQASAYVDMMTSRTSLPLELEALAKRLIRSEIRAKYAMLCLSAVSDSGLMWSHYADGHRGISVELDVEGNPDWRRRTRQVAYAEHPPEFDWFGSTDEEKLMATLFTKNHDWAYEQEWRVVDVDTTIGPGLRTLAPGAVKSVILGAEIQPDREQLVRRWAERNDVGLRVAFQNWGSYGVSVHDDPRASRRSA